MANLPKLANLSKPPSLPKPPNLSKSYSVACGLVALSLTALVAPAARAATFNFGDRAGIALYRGAGNLLGLSNSLSSDTSGIDTLAGRIDNAFLNDYAVTTRVFDSYEGNVFSFREVGSGRSADFVSGFGDRDGLGLVGYSAGGLSAIRAAKNVAPKPVDLLVQVESFEPLTGRSSEDEVLPGNVRKGINYYQRRNRFNFFRPGYDPTDLQGATSVRGSENINAEDLLRDRSLTHRNIISNSRLQERIVQDIRERVLSDLTFDRNNQLDLGQGAATKNNLLRLTPVSGSRQADVSLKQPVASNLSFRSRLDFRLPFETISEGLAVWIGPKGNDSAARANQLTLKIDPRLPGESFRSDKLQLLTPGRGSDSENSPFALNGRKPLTAWFDYDSLASRYEIFLSDNGNKPQAPLFVRNNLDLSGLGSNLFFGFRAEGSDDGQYADLLNWQLETFGGGALEADAVTAAWEGGVGSAALMAAEPGAIAGLPVANLQATLASPDSSQSVPEPGVLLGLGTLAGVLACSRRFALRVTSPAVSQRF